MSTQLPVQPEPRQARRRSHSGMFASLRVRNFRLYATGLAISNTGTWMQFIIQDWLVHTLTGSASAVGVTVTLQFLPTLLLGPYGGVLADRLPKQKVLLITQSVMGLACAMLAILTLSGQVQVWHVWLTSLIIGLVTIADTPCLQSFIGEIVGPDRLANAVNLNSATKQFTRLSGPAVASILMSTVGSGYAFLVNAASYAVMIGVLLSMRDSQLYPTKRPPRSKGQLREGFRYVAARPDLVRSIALVGFLGTFGFNLPVWLPAFTDHVFHRDAGAYDLMNCLVACGGLVGAVFALRRRNASSRLLFGAAVLFGALLAAASYAPEFWLFATLLVPIGVLIMTFNSTANTSVQLSAAPEMRGRVMALYMVVITGGTPIGAPLVGWVTDAYGPRFGMAAGGAVSALAAIAIFWALSPAGRRHLSACRRLGHRAMSRVNGRGRGNQAVAQPNPDDKPDHRHNLKQGPRAADLYSELGSPVHLAGVVGTVKAPRGVGEVSRSCRCRISRGEVAPDRMLPQSAAVVEGLDEGEISARALARSGGAGQDRAGGVLGIDRVGLATLPAHSPVRSVDFDRLVPVASQVGGESSAVGAGALTPKPRS